MLESIIRDFCTFLVGSSMSSINDIKPELEIILQIAIAKINPGLVYLFGSWARGDARSNSDIDLAFKEINVDQWSDFVNEIEYDAPVLRNCDLVRMDKLQPELMKHILDKGLIIFERKN